MKTVVIASNNAHKAEEIANALTFEGWEFKTLRQMGIEIDPEENGADYVDNARIKAQAAREASGGMAVLADDSGLSVDALDGAPGMHSARFAFEECDDDANNALLLEKLGDMPWEERTARYVCVLVFIDEDGTEVVAKGTVEGFIGYDLQGTAGFGYDPLFYPEAYDRQKTFAQVTQEEKAEISHRGNALRDLKEKLSA